MAGEQVQRPQGGRLQVHPRDRLQKGDSNRGQLFLLRFRESPLTGSEGEVRACGVRVRAWRGGVLRQGRDRHPGDPRGDMQPRAAKGGHTPFLIFSMKRDHEFLGPSHSGFRD